MIRPNKHVRGAFVEYGLSIPPILFMFQYNPQTLGRVRTASYKPPGAGDSSDGGGCSEKSEAQERSQLAKVSVTSETINLTLQLDATEDLNSGEGAGEKVAQIFGIGPQLAALELMLYPKTDQLFGFPIGNLLGGTDQFGPAQAKAIPILLFIWGYKRIAPVVMTSLNITEQEFFPDLTPKRASAVVALQVLEGFNPPYLYHHGWRTALSAMNLANIGDFANVF